MIYGLSSQKHQTSKYTNFPYQLLKSTQGLESTGQNQKNVRTLHEPTIQEQTLITETTASSIYGLPNNKDTLSNHGLFVVENQKKPSADFCLNIIDGRSYPQKKIVYTESEVSHKRNWVNSTPLNRTEDTIKSNTQQDYIERIFNNFLKNPNLVSNKINLRIQQDEILKQFDVVKEWKESWSEHGLEKPTDLAISHAENVIETLLNIVISTDYRFITPIISGDGNGYVTAIWYNQKRQLHFKIGEKDVEYFKVWGTNINTEMEVNYLKFEQNLELWKWLINE